MGRLVAASRRGAGDRLTRGQGHEAVAGGVVGFDPAGLDVVDPAMDIQLASRQTRGHRRMGAKVVQLGDDVFPGKHLHGFVLAAAGAVVLDHGASHFGMTQPGGNGRHLGQRLRVEHRRIAP